MYLLYLLYSVLATYECISIDLYVVPLDIAYVHLYDHIFFVSNFDYEYL